MPLTANASRVAARVSTMTAIVIINVVRHRS